MKFAAKERDLCIEIRPIEKVMDDTLRVIEDSTSGKKIKPIRRVSFESIDVFRKFFTTERLNLLHIMKTKRPSSVYELAKMANRNIRPVQKDIAILKKLGIIDVSEEYAGMRARAKPKIKADALSFRYVF